MKTKSTLILVAIGSTLSLALSAPAAARDDYGRDHRHHHHKHWKHQGHGYGHERVIRERVVVERPVYVERYVTYAPPPPPRYSGIVLSVDIPPLVFPLR